MPPFYNSCRDFIKGVLYLESAREQTRDKAQKVSAGLLATQINHRGTSRIAGVFTLRILLEDLLEDKISPINSADSRDTVKR
jgi:hypothetical protein